MKGALFLMPKLPLRIEVVRSNSKALSSLSIESANSIVETLERHYTDVIITNIDTESDLTALIARKPDLAFLGMHYVRSEAGLHPKIWISDSLEKNDIRHTGSGKFSHRLGLNKHLAKQRMIESGLQTSPFQIIRRENEEIINEGKLSFPLFVKPSNKGGGQGIDEFSVVRTVEELRAKVATIHNVHHADALVEEFLVGREFSIALIGNHHSQKLTAMPIELIAAKDSNGERMLSKVVKSSNTEGVLEVTDPAERLRLKAFAINVFHALGARDYGRIDVRFDKFGVPHFLEANLIPSLIDGYGSFPKAYEMNLGLDYETMLMQIVRLALNREPKKILLFDN
ncbi:MAG: D-alanine--D-alanine ligase [Candidatus Saccharibacteria bacterium]|nr:D-alanine--D-alanine ligase [Candidatus Saccharibacteria bacterium]